VNTLTLFLLISQGVEVVRHGLSLEPNEFLKNEEVNKLMEKDGVECLPIIMLDDKVIFKGDYVSRVNLADICNVSYHNDDAPPIHREENCCCGLDCDCNLPRQKPEENSSE
jgi:hypothetical protein